MRLPPRTACVLVTALAALSTLAVRGDGTAQPPAIAQVALSSDPLYAASSGDKPALALALSVEYPTVGAQFVKGPDDVTDDTYDNENEYLGYYDAESCYAYANARQRFERQGSATRRKCTSAFSGNFLNWASGSAIDMLRLALSGGDRYTDTPELTVLQRAVIPNGDPMCMWNTTNFPAKKLQRNGGANNSYWGAVPPAMVSAAAGSDIWVANTLDRIYFGTARGGSCGDPGSYKLGSAAAGNLNSDGFFYARVKVCDQDAAGQLLDQRNYGSHPFCVRYPSGTYKPTGTIQQYSDSLRLAAFGYALDQTASYNAGRYGGVLRAPMKYVGAETFDVYGQKNTPAGGNPNAEWDPASGVLHANPDGDTSQAPAISGVINYLNKFGRTGPVKGRYKRYDPVGELHYEALRYLQGLPPSPDAVARLSADMYDGFPIYTDWSRFDPYADRPADGNYACLKSNIVVIGDVNTHDGSRRPSPSAAGNVLDIGQWIDVVTAFEKGQSRAYVDGQGTARSTSNPNATNPNPPTQQILGTAYWAHTHDIRGTGWTSAPGKQRPGLRVGTYIFDVNEYGHQSDAQRRHNNNQFFTAAKYGGFLASAQQDQAAPFNTWGNPFKNEDGSSANAVWEDPERLGEARNYFLQSDGRSVLAAFDKIFQRAGEASRNIAGGAVQSRHLTPGENNTVFQGAFDSRNWSGDLLAMRLQVDNNHQVLASSAPLWSAAERLALQADPAGTRNIVMGKTSADADGAATSFAWSALGDDIKAHLDKPTESSAPDGRGAQRVAWLRGSQAQEEALFRSRLDPLQGRQSLLGDIVNSGAVYSGAPAPTVNSSAYAAFRKTHANRRPTVFVGGNDGMLHAFRADTGDELFGYIPSWLAPALPALAGKDYVGRHQSYVDATPAVAEALVGGSDVEANWKTVLVGGTGAGGRGVFALNVTDPSAFDASKVLWEFTSNDDASLGFVLGQPRILKFRTSAPGAASATYKWFAVVASGVNSHLPDRAGHFSDGRPALFLLDLAKPAGTAWQAGTNYFKILFPFDATLANTRAPGLLNFKEALGARQEVSTIYAGDLHGRMWKLDFAKQGAATWQLEKLSPFRNAESAQPYPLFVARNAAGDVQSISAAPFLARGDQPNTVLVAFGTGKYVEAADRANTSSDSFYVVYDDGQAHADNSNPAGAVPSRSQLMQGRFDAASGSVQVDAFAWGRRRNAQDTVSRPGWFFDFPAAGERMVSGVANSGDALIFSSLLPPDSNQNRSCAAGSGSGRQYVANVDDGNATSDVSRVGLLGQGLVLDLDGATVEGATDSTGRRIRTVTRQIVSQGTGGVAVTATVTERQVAGRLSWRQIHNYQELRAESP